MKKITNHYHRLIVAIAGLATVLIIVCVTGRAVGDALLGGVEQYETVAVDRQLLDKPLFVSAVLSCDDGVWFAQKGADKVVLLSNDLKKELRVVNVPKPTGVVVDRDFVYVTSGLYDVYKFDKDGLQVVKTAIGLGVSKPIISGEYLYILEQFTNRVVKLNKSDLIQVGYVEVAREPKDAVIVGDKMYIANFLPAQKANVDMVAADVSVVDLVNFKQLSRIKLANGSNALRGVGVTADGQYVLVSHNLGRYTVPTSQLTQGWMNTSAMSVISTKDDSYVGAIVLDEPDRGAAGAWGIQCSKDHIYVSHSGTHDVSVIDYHAFKAKLEGYAGDVETLAYDLRFMYGIRNRVALVGNGPRDMVVLNEGGEDVLLVNTYFSDTVNVLKGRQLSVAPMVKNRSETLAQKGERIFNDAGYCYQNWQSCNGCHPGDARTDGMNWDLMNDGIGNQKNCKSLLYSIQTPPSMISGIRTSAELANRKGFTHIQFYDIPEDMALAVDAYVGGLEALPSPYLVNGQLSESAKEGRKVYQKLNCDLCHSGPYYTDLKMHKIGADIEFENGWDTPTLREVWRTAPYLFDGRAETMKEVFDAHKHSVDKKLSKKDLDNLCEYVLSL